MDIDALSALKSQNAKLLFIDKVTFCVARNRVSRATQSCGCQMTALFDSRPLQGRERSEQVPCRRGSIEGEPKCRLYEKGAPFGAPLIQAISTLVASWRQHGWTSMRYLHIKRQNVKKQFIDRVALRVARNRASRAT